MSRDGAFATGIFVILVAIVVAAGAGAFSTRSTTSRADPVGQVPEPSSDSSAGVVFDLRRVAGRTILGLKLAADTYEAHIGIIVPPECLQANDAGDDEVLTEGECANLPAHGDLSGSGITALGLRLAIVRVAVSQACYRTLIIGETWPPLALNCQAGLNDPDSLN